MQQEEMQEWKNRGSICSGLPSNCANAMKMGEVFDSFVCGVYTVGHTEEVRKHATKTNGITICGFL